jgi:hypothetical protein
MGKRNMFVGLDVHKDTIDVSIADRAGACDADPFGTLAVNADEQELGSTPTC